MLWERRIEQLVEGLFSRWTGHRIQPFEIRRQLLREMERGAVGGSRVPVLPNEYDVRLHADDFAPYRDAPPALIRDLVETLHARAGELGGSFEGPVRIALMEDDAVPAGEVHVEARVRPSAGDNDATRRGPRRPRPEPPRLRLLSDDAAGDAREFPIDQPAVTIGREAGHPIVLADPRVSRTHARVELGPSGATIIDLGSTNGTILNGRRL